MQLSATARIFTILGILSLAPLWAHAYGQGYYEGGYYGEGYYQGYYQSSYYAQSSYQTTVTADALFLDDLSISDSISKGYGTFVIDHPLDALNKLLYHSFVESPDVKNLYDGVATLDRKGEATIRLPDYFEALNKDFRYQLKPIGAPMPNLHVKDEIQSNQFVIGGGVPGGEVSWQVTGTRHDAYIEANPVVVEVPKGPNAIANVGEYLYSPDDGRAPVSVGAFFSRLTGIWNGLNISGLLNTLWPR